MARGWESKSVEEQQSSEARPAPRATVDEDPEVRSRRESLVLSRKRIVRELEETGSDVRKKNLSAALAFLDAELAKLPQ
jgi:hypothetical protein